MRSPIRFALSIFGAPARGVALVALVAPLAACAGAPAGSSSSGEASAKPAERRAAGGALRYDVDVGPGAAEVRVEASLPAGSAPELGVDPDAERFLRDVMIERGGAFEPVASLGRSWLAPSCEEVGCRLRYRFLLADAADAINDFGIASEHGGVLLAPPSSWLLRPLHAPDVKGESYEFHVSAPVGISFVTGVFPVAGRGPSTFGADLSDLPDAPYSAFGAMRTSVLAVPGGEVVVAIVPGDLGEADAVVLEWIANAADTVSRYYGRFPVRHALVMVLPTEDGGLGYARTLGNGGASIVAPVGKDARRDHFVSDWVMTHEMIHLAFPNVPRRQTWIEEGIATYVEPFARARLGKLSVESAWRGLARGLPRGQPEAGDRGLDFTPTWGRRYWGGALFCFLADVEIRERTSNRRSLDDALRAIVRAGGTVASRWSLARAFEEGDRATGVPVLRELHARMGSAPVVVDLDALWARLGVKVSGRSVSFDDTAPLASIRRSMTGPGAPGQ